MALLGSHLPKPIDAIPFTCCAKHVDHPSTHFRNEALTAFDHQIVRIRKPVKWERVAIAVKMKQDKSGRLHPKHVHSSTVKPVVNQVPDYHIEELGYRGMWSI